MRGSRGWYMRVVVVPLVVLLVAGWLFERERRAEAVRVEVVRAAAADLVERAQRGDELIVVLAGSEAMLVRSFVPALRASVGTVGPASDIAIAVDRTSSTVYTATVRADGVVRIGLDFAATADGAVLVGFRTPDAVAPE